MISRVFVLPPSLVRVSRTTRILEAARRFSLMKIVGSKLAPGEPRNSMDSNAPGPGLVPAKGLCGAAQRRSLVRIAAVDQLANCVALPPLAAIVDAGVHFAQQTETKTLNASSRAENSQRG